MSDQGPDDLELRLRLLRAELGLRRPVMERAGVESGSCQPSPRELELARELELLRGSIRFRLGGFLVEAVRSPRTLTRLPGMLARVMRRGLRMESALASIDSLAPGAVPRPPGPVHAAELHELPAPPVLDCDLGGLRVAAVLDTFSASSFAPECKLLELGVATWAEQIREFNPHLLLVESAWLGRDKEWEGKVDRGSDVLRSLVASCRHAGIPTVFWNKEDPLHFEAFLDAARLFDHVFTTDADSIPQYRAELGHERVYLLPFALQPRSHHPVQTGERRDAAFFAGAWYGSMDQRSADFRAVAGAVSLAFPLQIFDRNQGGGDATRRFPPPYDAMVHGGVPYEQTPDLYRGFRVGLNLNTIKQSPTMFARRVLELIGCNTSVYGNYARGLKLLLGDLTVASDDAERLLRLAWDEAREPDAPRYRLRRLRALRKVLEEHTWTHRLQAVAKMALGHAPATGAPPLLMLGRATDEKSLERLLAAHARQRGVHARLVIWVPEALRSLLPDHVHRPSDEELAASPGESFAGHWIAPVHGADYLGADYLRDMSLGWRYTRGETLGKAAFHRRVPEGLVLQAGELEYRRVPRLALRRSLLPASRWAGSLGALLEEIASGVLEGDDLVSLDALSYCEDGADQGLPEFESLEIDIGRSLADLEEMAGRFPLAVRPGSADAPGISGSRLARAFSAGVVPPGISASPLRQRMELCSTMPPGREDALFTAPIHRTDLERDDEVVATLVGTADPAINYYLDSLDAAGGRLHRTVLTPGWTARLAPLPGTGSYRLAVQVRGSLVRHLDGMLVGDTHGMPQLLPGKGRLLVVCNGYPATGNLYRNAFLHRRVLEYRRRGIAVDVVVVSAMQAEVQSYEFEDVPVTYCSPDSLRATLALSGHSAIAVHFLDRHLWHAVRDAASHTPTVVWLHGAEVQPWTRRSFNYQDETQRAAAKLASDDRIAFWRELLTEPPAHLRLAFVSRRFAEQTWDDLGLRLPEERWRVVHNPVDTRLFRSHGKPVEQRFRVLSIRPHGYRIYANDLVADVIRRLAGHPLFPAMQFHLIGDGALFNENFAGLDAYPNVRIERRFLRQEEVAVLHRDYGVFLVPTRGDTQGVSRDEAMASGLVPVTNDVGSVSEFVDASCAIIAGPEDAGAMAEGLLALAGDPARFQLMSRAAAERVRKQCDISLIVDQELEWIGPICDEETQ